MADERETPLLSFTDAETIGIALHDRWEKMTGEPPLTRDDLGWADVVQFIIREARAIDAAKREVRDDG
jgi:hypothetical protein